MTYLEMVNNVLKRLRERTVSSVSENTYSAMIGMLINDSANDVENAWDWSHLRTTFTATTSADVSSYELTGSGNRFKLLDAFNDTNDIPMREKDSVWMNRMFLSEGVQTGEPIYFNFNGTTADGELYVDVYPIPDGVYTLRFNGTMREGDYSNDADVISLPTKPVELLAYAKAIEERGEDGGVGASSAYATAMKSLSDNISFDAARNSSELIWGEV